MAEEKIIQTELQAVIFMLNNIYYGVEILQVQEIVKMTDIVQLPNTPDFIEGIVNLRGKIVPIMDLRKRFHLPSIEINENWKILILKVKDMLFGIMVDAISEVEKIETDVIEKAPKVVSGVNGEFISGIAKLEERLLILLDTEKILTLEEQKALKELESE